MVELVDTLDLKSNDHYDRGGSSPPPGTKLREYLPAGRQGSVKEP